MSVGRITWDQFRASVEGRDSGHPCAMPNHHCALSGKGSALKYNTGKEDMSVSMSNLCALCFVEYIYTKSLETSADNTGYVFSPAIFDQSTFPQTYFGKRHMGIPIITMGSNIVYDLATRRYRAVDPTICQCVSMGVATPDADGTAPDADGTAPDADGAPTTPTPAPAPYRCDACRRADAIEPVVSKRIMQQDSENAHSLFLDFLLHGNGDTPVLQHAPFLHAAPADPRIRRVMMVAVGGAAAGGCAKVVEQLHADMGGGGVATTTTTTGDDMDTRATLVEFDTPHPEMTINTALKLGLFQLGTHNDIDHKNDVMQAAVPANGVRYLSSPASNTALCNGPMDHASVAEIAMRAMISQVCPMRVAGHAVFSISKCTYPNNNDPTRLVSAIGRDTNIEGPLTQFAREASLLLGLCETWSDAMVMWEISAEERATRNTKRSKARARAMSRRVARAAAMSRPESSTERERCLIGAPVVPVPCHAVLFVRTVLYLLLQRAPTVAGYLGLSRQDVAAALSLYVPMVRANALDGTPTKELGFPATDPWIKPLPAHSRTTSSMTMVTPGTQHTLWYCETCHQSDAVTVFSHTPDGKAHSQCGKKITQHKKHGRYLGLTMSHGKTACIGCQSPDVVLQWVRRNKHHTVNFSDLMCTKCRPPNPPRVRPRRYIQGERLNLRACRYGKRGISGARPDELPPHFSNVRYYATSKEQDLMCTFVCMSCIKANNLPLEGMVGETPHPMELFPDPYCHGDEGPNRGATRQETWDPSVKPLYPVSSAEKATALRAPAGSVAAHGPDRTAGNRAMKKFKRRLSSKRRAIKRAKSAMYEATDGIPQTRPYNDDNHTQ